jgi:GTP-binding protein
MSTVAIVGRPNVGKSALFNRLAGRRIAIVHDQPGITRDRISAPCKATAHACTIIDTGGIGASLDDGFADQVAIEADIAMHTSDLILFVVDAQEGLSPIDRALAQKLRKAKPPVLLVINKVDDPKHESAFAEFSQLGFEDPVAVSAEHGRNFGELVERVDIFLAPLAAAQAEVAVESQAVGIRLAIIGKPNAGKSSLANAILHDSRTIVSEIAGTTRDAVDLPYLFQDEPFTLIDTAGLRPRGKRDSSVEVFSAMRTEKAIRRCDLCILVIDLASGISAQDRKIAQLILEEKKPCLIALNKFDLYHPDAPRTARLEEAEEHVRRELFFLSYAPFIAVSAKLGQGADRILKEALRIRKSSQNVPGTGVLNRILQQAFQVNPPPIDNKLRRRLKLYYATAAVEEKYNTIPVPTYVLFVNDKRLMSQSYEQYISNKLRDAHHAPAVPVVLSVRSRTRKEFDDAPVRPNIRKQSGAATTGTRKTKEHGDAPTRSRTRKEPGDAPARSRTRKEPGDAPARSQTRQKRREPSGRSRTHKKSGGSRSR